MNILICASIGSQNLGDELILKNEVVLLEKEYSERLLVAKKDFRFSVFSYSPKERFFEKENVIYKPYFPSGSKSIIGVLKNIKNFFVFFNQVRKADIVVFGGGGIIYDNEYQKSAKPLRQWEFRALICRLLKKRVDFFRVGISIKNPDNYAAVESIFSGAEYISVRDDYSYSLLKKLGFESKLDLEEDPVFSDKRTNLILQSGSGRTLSRYISKGGSKKHLLGSYDSKAFSLEDIKECLERSGQKLKGKRIGISFRQLDVKGYNERVVELLEWMLHEKAELVMIPHSFHKTDLKANDYKWLLSMKSDLEKKHKTVQISICKSMQESYDIYTEGKIDINFAQRLHAIILSSVYEIPFIGMSYGTKTKELLAEFRKS